MARNVALLAFGVVIGIVGGAAVGLHADQADLDVREAAAAAGYDEHELAAALSTLDRAGMPSDPWTYARFEGRLPPLKPPPIPDKWQRLAQCEASGDWHNTSNRVYSGGLQFDAQTWARHGGLAFASSAAFATPAQQVIVAERTLAAQGPGAWPNCGPRTGLR